MIAVFVRAFAFFAGIGLAYAISCMVPSLTVYPSEANLMQIYKDVRGVCYIYRRVAADC